MRFLFKDLKLTVSSSDSPHCGGCGSVISCPLPTVQCGPVTCGITSVIHAEEFDVMKLDLQQALDVVRATAELDAETKLEPETVEEAAELEEKLSKALEAVRATKYRLQGS